MSVSYRACVKSNWNEFLVFRHKFCNEWCSDEIDFWVPAKSDGNLVQL